MDRRSWLWRRKSSEKSASGETESSGSASSHSERFYDDQTIPNHDTQSPDVTSKAAASDEELNDSVKILSEKLSEALLNISAKEDSVKQHAKVAEEAVAGWERAEDEVLLLKKQVDALTLKNSTLEERVVQLDGALKECLRQIRQAREQQKEKICDAVIEKSSEWESAKSELEDRIIELHSQLRDAKTDAVDTMLADVRCKLEAAEKDNSILKLKLVSKAKELELRTSERDLSTHAAEVASKQHLDSIKRVAKLEAECRRLKVMARTATLVNNQRSINALSIYAESLTDRELRNGERTLVSKNGSYKMSGLESIDSDQYHTDSSASAFETVLGQVKNEKSLERSLIVPSVEIDLMDDFLEMERLASLPELDSGSCHGREVRNGEAPLRVPEATINRTAELEEKLRNMEGEKVSLEIALNECQIQLKTSEDQLKKTQVKLEDLSAQMALANKAKKAAEKDVEITKQKLNNTTKLLGEAEVNLVQIQNQLSTANEVKRRVKVELKEANTKKAEAESKVKVVGFELQTLHSRIFILEEEVKKERNISEEALAKCEILNNEISGTKLDSQFKKSDIMEEFRINQDKELAVAASKFSECQKTIASIGRQLKSLATFEDLVLDSERPITVS